MPHNNFSYFMIGEKNLKSPGCNRNFLYYLCTVYNVHWSKLSAVINQSEGEKKPCKIHTCKQTYFTYFTMQHF